MNCLRWLYWSKNPCPCGNRTFANVVIIKAREARGHWPSAFQVLMMHWVISAWAWVLAFIPWPIRTIKAAMWKSCLSAHPFSAWIVSWSWNESSVPGGTLCIGILQGWGVNEIPMQVSRSVEIFSSWIKYTAILKRTFASNVKEVNTFCQVVLFRKKIIMHLRYVIYLYKTNTTLLVEISAGQMLPA